MRMFSEEEIAEIRMSELSCRELAEKFRTTTTTIGTVVNKTGSYSNNWIPTWKRTEAKEQLALKMKDEIIRLYHQGMSYREIAISRRISIRVTKEIVEKRILDLLHQEVWFKERDKKMAGKSFTGYSLRKLSDEQVKEMRRLWDEGVPCWELGRMFGVSRFTAYKVVRRKGAYGPRRQQTKPINDLRNIVKKRLISQ